MKKTALAVTFIALATAALAQSYRLGYGDGEIDPQLAHAAERTNNAIIVEGVFYEIGYGEGQIDPKLAAAIKK
jgi:hypothetical protein